MSIKPICLAFALSVASGVPALAEPATPPTQSAVSQSAYGFTFPSIDGGDLDFSAFEGKPLLVVNTASMCGYTKQYEGLQTVYDAYKDEGLVVVGIPSKDFKGQEYDDAAKTKEFCTVNFGITFPMSTRQHVIGDDAHGFYKWTLEELGEEAEPQWNFHKILIGRDGQPVKAYRSKVKPQDKELIADIEALL